MAKTKRYIIGHRYGPQLDPRSRQDLDAFISQHKDAKLVRRTPVGRTVLEMTTESMRDLADKNPQLVIEEDADLEPFAMPGLPQRVPSQGSYSLPVIVRDCTTGKPVADVTVYAVGEGVAYKAVTGEDGQATVQTYESTLSRLVASPQDSYWSRVLPDVTLGGQPLQIGLKPLLAMGSYDWGHQLVGLREVNGRWSGSGIKIAVVDSGISSQQPDVKPAGGFNTLDGQDPNAWNIDEEGHGTHIAGIIGAQKSGVGILGGAPNAAIYAVKVLPGGRLSDLVEAVEWCIRNQMDVINMSLGSPAFSQVLAGVLRDAYDRGITLLAAAGNGSTHVAYPAALPFVIAVGALGRFGTFPQDSAQTLTITQTVDLQGILFAPTFSNFGPEIDVAAPGVAILSTVPTGFAAWDGTSMACPMVTAMAALILEAYPSIRTGNSQQVESVRAILNGSAANLGMPPLIQGRGLPLAPRALAAAARA